MCLMHFGGVRKEKIEEILSKFDFKKRKKSKKKKKEFGFENHLKSWTYNSYHKNKFSNGSVENFPKFFKIFVSPSFDWSSLFSD